MGLSHLISNPIIWKAVVPAGIGLIVTISYYFYLAEITTPIERVLLSNRKNFYIDFSFYGLLILLFIATAISAIYTTDFFYSSITIVVVFLTLVAISIISKTFKSVVFYNYHGKQFQLVRRVSKTQFLVHQTVKNGYNQILPEKAVYRQKLRTRNVNALKKEDLAKYFI